jgi:2-hydroxychromene-2-carboxylate isomerase
MSIGSRIKGRAIAAFLGPTGRGARELLAAARRGITRKPVRLEFFHDLVDPWSYLTAQAVDRLVKAYPGLALEVTVISAPASDVDPAPDLRAKHAVRDARELATFWDVSFQGKKEADPTLLRKISTALIKPRPAEVQLQAILDLCGGMWDHDHKRVDAALIKIGFDSQAGVAPALATSYAQLRDKGHYQGAMLSYKGEWYWGLDRLVYLEQAIAADLGVEPVGVIKQRPEAERGPLLLTPTAATPLVMDLWFSFRSPYSYLALERITDVIGSAPVEIRLRPVPPMVERGFQVPRIKRMYIVQDAKREADRLGIEFGYLCDPLGAAVTNCLAIEKWAIAEGKGLDFARSAMRGIWSEALDLASYVDLRTVVERAGLGWDGARAALADPEVGSWTTTNAADLAVISLWGVPSFRIGDLVTWGQDRLDLIADRLRRHAAAVAQPTPAATTADSA